MSALADAFCFHKCFPAVYNWDVYALLIFLFRCHKKSEVERVSVLSG